MQKLINTLAVASFVVSGAVVGAGGYVYLNRDAIVENIKSQIMEGVAGAIQDQIGDLGSIGGGVPGGESVVPNSVPGVPF